VTSPLRALVSRLVDYAGLYPPAALSLPEVLDNYRRYLASEDGWILSRLVLPAAKLGEVRPGDNWRVTLLVEQDPGPLAPQVETLEYKGGHKLSLPTYCEVPLDQIESGFAKVRTGGLTPDVIPPAAQIADFLIQAAARRLPFKATAGLHHAIRAQRKLTYAADSPCGVMHGFINVFVAAAFAWYDADRALILDVLQEDNESAFEFREDEMRWRGNVLTTSQIAAARRDFAHSFGSCSFEEPVADLHALQP